LKAGHKPPRIWQLRHTYASIAPLLKRRVNTAVADTESRLRRLYSLHSLSRSRSLEMKQLLLSLVVTAGVAAMSSAYAQQMPTDQPMDQTQAQSAAPADTGQGGVNWGSAAQGGRNVAETRQDVRQQLIQSERDGQLQTLDQTVYKGN